jgi:hypothetical protein
MLEPVLVALRCLIVDDSALFRGGAFSFVPSTESLRRIADDAAPLV